MEFENYFTLGIMIRIIRFFMAFDYFFQEREEFVGLQENEKVH